MVKDIIICTNAKSFIDTSDDIANNFGCKIKIVQTINANSTKNCIIISDIDKIVNNFWEDFIENASEYRANNISFILIGKFNKSKYNSDYNINLSHYRSTVSILDPNKKSKDSFELIIKRKIESKPKYKNPKSVDKLKNLISVYNDITGVIGFNGNYLGVSDRTFRRYLKTIRDALPKLEDYNGQPFFKDVKNRTFSKINKTDKIKHLLQIYDALRQQTFSVNTNDTSLYFKIETRTFRRYIKELQESIEGGEIILDKNNYWQYISF